MAELKVVLFGMPDSGKTSLLGALWESAQQQGPLLGSKVNDLSGGLAQLHANLYAKAPANGAPESDRYPVALESSIGGSRRAVLIDCDSQAAVDCLMETNNCLKSGTPGAKAVLDADALLLLVDPTAGSAQLEKEFQQFCTFVQSLEKHRSHRSEVAGLPVYLVLTKCDLLSKPTDSGSVWVQRIEEGKRKIDKRFHEFLNKNPQRASLPFGKVDAKVWATAVKRPALADKPKSQEPYGVAELFRQTFQSAEDFHEQRRKAAGWLQIVLLSFLGLIAVMALAAGVFFVLRPSPEMTNLEGKIREAIPSRKSGLTEQLRELLKEPLDARLNQLHEITKDPAFEKLPSTEKEDVQFAVQQIESYQTENAKFLKILAEDKVPDPKFVKNDGDLKKIDAFLAKVPVQKDWSETSLGKRQELFRKDSAALREAVAAEVARLTTMVAEGKKLKETGHLIAGAAAVDEKKRGDWLKQAKDFLARQAKENKDTDKLPGSQTIYYSVVYNFPQVTALQSELASIKKKLTELRTEVEP